MRPRYGRKGSQDSKSSSLLRILASAGPMMLSSRITVGGTGKMAITIITGMIPFMTAPVTFAETIRRSRATTSFTVRTPRERWSVMTDRVTRSEWRPARNGSVAGTWMQTSARRPGISSACNGSLPQRESTAPIPTPLRHRTSQTTPGSARLRKDVQPPRCRLQSNHKPLLVL
jgi:hypothetical protein